MVVIPNSRLRKKNVRYVETARGIGHRKNGEMKWNVPGRRKRAGNKKHRHACNEGGDVAEESRTGNSHKVKIMNRIVFYLLDEISGQYAELFLETFGKIG